MNDFDKNFGISNITEKVNIATLHPLVNDRQTSLQYTLGNSVFEWMDARLLYYFLQKNNPKRIIEIGSGNSTLLIYNAKKLLNLDLQY